MSGSGMDRNSVYAAAQGREFVRDELKGKSNQYVREFAGLVDDAATLDLLNHYCSVYQDRGERFLDTRLGEEILSRAATNMADRAYKEGNVSQLQGMVGLTENSGEAKDALSEIVKRLSQEGTIAVVVGPPGAGKTATTLDVGRAWGSWTGGRLFGNTAWDGYDGIVRSDLEMLESMAETEGPTLGIIDEAAQSLTGRGADSKDAETFANRMLLIRKSEKKHGPHPKRGSLMAVSHNWDRLNAPTRRLATLIISKPSRTDPGKVVLWSSPGGEDKREKIGEYQGLTDTRESYPEHEASEFVVAADDSDTDDSESVDIDEIRRAERVRSYLLDCRPWDGDGGISQKEAAEKQGYSSSWATDRKAEWANGEWNSLDGVPEPSNGVTE
jgi:hypothetical protein